RRRTGRSGAGVVRRPDLRGRPRLHRHGVLRRLHAAGQLGGRGRSGGRRAARVRAGPVRRHPAGAAPVTVVEPVAPAYDGGTLGNLLPSALTAVGRGSGWDGPTIPLPEARYYVVLLVDGLGWEPLRR